MGDFFLRGWWFLFHVVRAGVLEAAARGAGDDCVFEDDFGLEDGVLDSVDEFGDVAVWVFQLGLVCLGAVSEVVY